MSFQIDKIIICLKKDDIINNKEVLTRVYDLFIP